jgi:hypothetical protein
VDADEKSGIVALPAILPSKQDTGWSTRLGALATLGAIAFGVCYTVYSVYTAARDAFVVPTIMSPSSEAVVATKLRLGELRVERVRAVGELESVEADLAGADQALTRLLDLKRTTGEGRHWTTRITSQKARESAAELTALSSQKQVLANMLASQQRLTARAQRDFEAGLISRSEYAHQEQALNEMRLAMLDNGRATVRGESAQEESTLRPAGAQPQRRPADTRAGQPSGAAHSRGPRNRPARFRAARQERRARCARRAHRADR